MKRHFIYIVFLIVITFSSCFEDADLNYPELHQPKLVIEALVTNSGEPFVVKLSETTGLADTLSGKPVNTADVYINDNLGNEEHLTLSEQGLYESQNMKATIGNIYTLKVNYKEETYVSEDTMRSSLPIDSLYIINMKDHGIYEDGKYLTAIVKLDEESIEYSRVVFSVNDSLYDGYQDLLLFETSFLTSKSHVFIPYSLNSGDKVELQVFSISKDLYHYFITLYQITTSVFNTSLSSSQNPPSNILGNCLGYFQVSSVNTYTFVVP